jgi:ATP-dependent Clp protease, protease subunit
MREPLRVIEGTAKPHEPFWVIRDSASSQSGETEIEFNGVISEYSWWGDEVTPAMFKADLNDIGKGGPVTVLVNSPGGEVVAASIIRTILQEYPGKVTADIVGIAASAATIVVTGADHIRMRESAYFMIHDPSGLAYGNIDEIKSLLESLKTIKNTIIDTYETKTGMDRAKLAKLMHDETWMTAREAKDYGFIDEVVTGSIKKSAALNAGFVNCLRNYANVPVDLLNIEPPVALDPAELEKQARLRAEVKLLV